MDSNKLKQLVKEEVARQLNEMPKKTTNLRDMRKIEKWVENAQIRLNELLADWPEDFDTDFMYEIEKIQSQLEEVVKNAYIAGKIGQTTKWDSDEPDGPNRNRRFR